MLLRDQVGISAIRGDSLGGPVGATQRAPNRALRSTLLLTVAASLVASPVVVSATASASGVDAAALPQHTRVLDTEESWADLRVENAPSAAELNENPGAASRARLRDPAEVSACVAAEGAANGSRTLTAQQQVYEPMIEGTYQISSRFGGRIDPVFGTWRMHNGDDYSAPSGTPILAVADGVVQTVGFDWSRGYYTEIIHDMEDGSTVVSAYFHQQSGSQVVVEGQEVLAGQQIGGVGSTGKSTGPHLHFEINDLAGNAVSPSAWLQAQNAVFVGQDCA